MPEGSSTALNPDFGALPRQNMTWLLLSPFLLACHYPCEDPGEPGPHCRWNSASLPGHTLPRQESGAISKGHQQQAGGPAVGDASSVRASDGPTQHGATAWRTAFPPKPRRSALCACAPGRARRRKCGPAETEAASRPGGSVARRRKWAAGGVGANMSASLLRRGLELLEAPGGPAGAGGRGEGDSQRAVRVTPSLFALQDRERPRRDCGRSGPAPWLRALRGGGRRRRSPGGTKPRSRAES